MTACRYTSCVLADSPASFMSSIIRVRIADIVCSFVIDGTTRLDADDSLTSYSSGDAATPPRLRHRRSRPFNPQIQDAVVRNIEIIGEAVSHINRMAPDFIAGHPQLPWAQMRDMRNLVIHAYFAIDLKVVWTTVRNDLPALKQQIDELLNKERNGPHGSERAPDEGSRPRGGRGRRPKSTRI